MSKIEPRDHCSDGKAMSLSVLEFTIFGLHLFFLLVALVVIQSLNAGKTIREFQVQETEEAFVEKEWDQEESDGEESPFDPTSEPYTMTENPMLRHRTNTNPLREAPPLSTQELSTQELNMDDVD